MDLVEAEAGATCNICHAPAAVVDLDAPCDQGFYCEKHDPRSGSQDGPRQLPAKQ